MVLRVIEICESAKTSDKKRHSNLFYKRLRNNARVLSSYALVYYKAGFIIHVAISVSFTNKA